MRQLQLLIDDKNPLSHIRNRYQTPRQLSLCLTILSLCLIHLSVAQEVSTTDNTNKDTQQSVFAPYIAAHHQWQSKQESSATGRTVGDPVGDMIDSETGMTEYMARAEMLSKSAAKRNEQKKSRQKPYAQGHTFIPTVNLKKTNDTRQHDLTHASTEQKLKDKTNATDPSRSSSSSALETIVENTTTFKTEESKILDHKEKLQHSNTIKTKGAVDAMSQLEQNRKTSDHLGHVQSEHVEELHEGTLKGSFVVPLFAIGAVAWLLSIVLKKTGIYTPQSRRKARLVRKKLASPRMVA